MKEPRWFDGRRRFVVTWIVAVFCLCSSATPTSAQGVSQITIPLGEYESSGVSGMASLSAAGNYVEVSMTMSGEPIVGDHPTHIHTGTCDNFDPNPIFPLTTVVLGSVDGEGQSRSLVTDVSLRDLLSDDYVILVHKSAEELTNYFVCGDISGETLASIPDDGPGAGSDSDKPRQVGHQRISKVPSAGSGDPSSTPGYGDHLATGVGAVALALALGGVAVMKRTSRDLLHRDPRR